MVARVVRVRAVINLGPAHVHVVIAAAVAGRGITANVASAV